MTDELQSAIDRLARNARAGFAPGHGHWINGEEACSLTKADARAILAHVEALTPTPSHADLIGRLNLCATNAEAAGAHERQHPSVGSELRATNDYALAAILREAAASLSRVEDHSAEMFKRAEENYQRALSAENALSRVEGETRDECIGILDARAARLNAILADLVSFDCEQSARFVRGHIKGLERARLAWQQDAAARLDTYVGLLDSGLIGTPSQVRVSLIMPTLAMLEADGNNEHLDRCDLCGEEIPWGAKVAAVEDGGDACAKCAPPEFLVYAKDPIDIQAAIDRANECLSRADDASGNEGEQQ